jgi:hypothetical protein
MDHPSSRVDRSASRKLDSGVSQGIANALSRIDDIAAREQFIRELAREFPLTIFSATPSGAVRVDSI